MAVLKRLHPYLILLAALLVIVFPVFKDRTLTNFSDIYVVPPWHKHQPQGWFHSRSIDGSPIYFFNASDILNRELLKEGKSFTWNPYVGFGVPWLGGMQAAPYFPPKLISYLWPDYWKGQDAILILLLLTAGIGNYLLLRSMDVGREGAVFAGLSYMLCERLFLVINMPTFHIECLLPLMLFSVNEMVKKKSLSYAALAGLVGGAQFLGGFPESSFIFTVASSLFFLWVLAQDLKTPEVPWREMLLGLLVAAFSLAISGFQLGEFVRFLSLSETVHTSAYGSVVKEPYWLLPLFLPNFFGTPLQSFWIDGISTADHMPLSLFCGISTVLLAIVAVLARPSETKFYIWFFAALFVVFAGYDYGFPILRYLGSLPLFNLMSTAWNAFIIPFTLSVLAGFGLQSLLQRGAGKRIALALFVYGLVVFVLCLKLIPEYYPSIVRSLGPLLFVVPIFIASAVLIRRWTSFRMGSMLMFSLIVLESYLCVRALGYLHYYGLKTPDPPSLHWLSEHLGHERIFGINGVYPANTLNSKRIRDIRHFDAMYPKLYVDYAAAVWPGAQRNVYDAGNPEWKNFDDPLLDLAAVKFVISQGRLLDRNSFILNDILKNSEIETFNKEVVNTTSDFTIDNDNRRVLFEHPPSVVRYRTKVPANAKFVFGIGENPPAWTLGGDGTWFELTVRLPSGEEKTVYQKFYDPKHNPDDRRWVDVKLDFAAYAGKEIGLVLKTSSGRDGQGNNANAWDGWSGLYFETEAPLFTQVYKDDDVFIYHNERALPRARFVTTALKVPDGFAPANLKSRTADLTSGVFLQDYEGQPAPVPCAGLSPANVQYREDEPDQLRLHVSAPCRGFVVLADLFYPGWKAYVDGEETPIYKANYGLTT